MMKKKYLTPAIQVFPLKMQLYLQAYSVPIIIGDNDED